MTEDEAAARARVVACAREWEGTPFHDMARVKGVGVDCAQLLAASFSEAGLVDPVVTGNYSPQFMLHNKDERLVAFILRYAHEIDESNVGMGDVVTYRVGRSFAHAAIVVDWPSEIIHAHKLSGKVVAMRGDIADLQGRPRRFFSVWR
jgi:cell wall-associated NlpC family hydrolase